jgi:hypothetical protein
VHVRTAVADQVPDADELHATPKKPVTPDTAERTVNPPCEVTLRDERIWYFVSYHASSLGRTL